MPINPPATLQCQHLRGSRDQQNTKFDSNYVQESKYLEMQLNSKSVFVGKIRPCCKETWPAACQRPHVVDEGRPPDMEATARTVLDNLRAPISFTNFSPLMKPESLLPRSQQSATGFIPTKPNSAHAPSTTSSLRRQYVKPVYRLGSKSRTLQNFTIYYFFCS